MSPPTGRAQADESAKDFTDFRPFVAKFSIRPYYVVPASIAETFSVRE
jgi:hypothetical protein